MPDGSVRHAIYEGDVPKTMYYEHKAYGRGDNAKEYTQEVLGNVGDVPLVGNFNEGVEEVPMTAKFDPKKWVRDHEGFRDEVYLDTRGLPTVGVGHLITETSPYYGAQVGDIISPTQLEEQYNKDYEHHAELAAKNFKNFEKHPPHVQESLINMTFQMGNKPSKWKNFNKALEEGLETGNYQNAAYHAADSKWFREQTPKRARSVLDRLAYGDRSTYSYNRPEEFSELPDYTVPQYNEGTKEVPWYDKFVPESAKDTARGVKRGYQAYKLSMTTIHGLVRPRSYRLSLTGKSRLALRLSKNMLSLV